MVAQRTDSEERGVWYYLTHPFAAIGTLVAVGAGTLDPLVQATSGLVELIYPIVASLSGVAGLVPAIPTDLVRQVFVVIALAYVGLLVANAITKIRDRYI